jgi:hypothetical protein
LIYGPGVICARRLDALVQRAEAGRSVGGGKYNKHSPGHEAYNFLPLNGKVEGLLDIKVMRVK